MKAFKPTVVTIISSALFFFSLQSAYAPMSSIALERPTTEEDTACLSIYSSHRRDAPPLAFLTKMPDAIRKHIATFLIAPNHPFLRFCLLAGILDMPSGSLPTGKSLFNSEKVPATLMFIEDIIEKPTTGTTHVRLQVEYNEPYEQQFTFLAPMLETRGSNVPPTTIVSMYYPKAQAFMNNRIVTLPYYFGHVAVSEPERTLLIDRALSTLILLPNDHTKVAWEQQEPTEENRKSYETFLQRQHPSTRLMLPSGWEFMVGPTNASAKHRYTNCYPGHHASASFTCMSPQNTLCIPVSCATDDKAAYLLTNLNSLRPPFITISPYVGLQLLHFLQTGCGAEALPPAFHKHLNRLHKTARFFAGEQARRITAPKVFTQR